MDQDTVLKKISARRDRLSLDRLMGHDFTDGGNADFSQLDDGNEYALYFTLLMRVVGLVAGWYKQQGNNGDFEAQSVANILARLLNTIEALKIKYTFNPEHRLRVDLSASGFPNFLELDTMRTDCLTKGDQLLGMPLMPILKSALVSQLIGKKDDSPEILAQVSQRAYLEMIEEKNLLLPFTPGELIKRRTKRKGIRSYAYFWGCYDSTTNLPFVHVMTFDQDEEEEPLENLGGSYQEFLQVVSSEGARAPKVGVLALCIDDRLEKIHPKIIKRIGLGPLYAPFLMDNQTATSDPWQLAWQQVMGQFARRPDDFVLLFTDESVFSKAQQQKSSFLSKKKIREVFFFPDVDRESSEHGASVVYHRALLPHYLLQHVVGSQELSAMDFDSFLKITYNEGGTING